MTEENDDKLQETIEELSPLIVDGSWSEIFCYFQQGKLLICDRAINMAEVGALLVLDDDEKIKKLTNSGLMTPPSNEKISEWQDIPEEKIFNYLEIPPYCLAQLNTTEVKKRGPF